MLTVSPRMQALKRLKNRKRALVQRTSRDPVVMQIAGLMGDVDREAPHCSRNAVAKEIVRLVRTLDGSMGRSS